MFNVSSATTQFSNISTKDLIVYTHKHVIIMQLTEKVANKTNKISLKENHKKFKSNKYTNLIYTEKVQQHAKTILQ